MKKLFIISTSALVLFSCSNLQVQNPQGSRVVVPAANVVLPQTDFYLTKSGVNYLQDLLEKDFSSNQIREYLPSQINSTMEVYAGETLVIKNLNADRIKIISSPVKNNFEFETVNNTVQFRSNYQGLYVAEIYRGFTYLGTLKIKNKFKYNFTEKDNYAIILDSYKNNDLDLLIKSSQLYFIAFPTSNKQKDVAFMLLDLGSTSGNTALINDRIKYLKESFSLTEDEKIKLLLLEEKMNGNIFTVDNYYLDYNRNNLKLNTEIRRVVERKNRGTTEEIEFLEKFYNDIQDNQLAKIIGTLYLQNNEFNKGNYYLSLAGSSSQVSSDLSNITNEIQPSTSTEKSLTTEVPSIPVSGFNKILNDGKDALNRRSYNEALIFFNKAEKIANPNELNDLLFYRGKTYFLMGSYDNSLTDLEKITSNSENLSETYYYLGVIYHKNGDLEKAKDYLRKSRENNPSSTWGRKSSIYLLKL